MGWNPVQSSVSTMVVCFPQVKETSDQFDHLWWRFLWSRNLFFVCLVAKDHFKIMSWSLPSSIQHYCITTDHNFDHQPLLFDIYSAYRFGNPHGCMPIMRTLYIGEVDAAILTLALAEGVDVTPMSFFCDARRTIGQIVLKFSIVFGASFAQLVVTNWPGHVSSQSYDVTKGTRSTHFCAK